MYTLLKESLCNIIEALPTWSATMKKCFKCKEEKELSEFYQHKTMSDGYLGKCKDCTKKDAYILRHHSKSREKILAYDRARGGRQSAEYLQEYRQRFPKKYKAHNLVRSLIRKGILFRKPCEICSSLGADAHHDDYDKPLDVRWLCVAHHRKWHAENGEALNGR